MRLVLELASPQSEALASAPRFVVGYEPILIGRDAHCDWVFNDRYVSGQHAQIRFFNGLFFVEAIGRNPIAIDDPGQQVPRGKSQPLRDGCKLFIDVHEVKVSVRDDETLAPGPQRPTEPAREPAAPPASVSSDPGGLADIDFGAVIGSGPRADAPDVIGLMGEAGERCSPSDRSAAAFDFDPLSAAFEPQRPLTPDPDGDRPVDIPADADWWKKGDTSRKHQATAPASVPAATPVPRVGDSELAELLRGAGIDPGQVDLGPEAAHQLGEILRIVVEGTMDVLRARAEIKEQFRLAGTRVQRKDNNPLKFSADVNDALHNLLVKRSEAYLPPVEAFDVAFEEIRRHQLAMLQGLRVAFDQLMRRLDPKKLAEGVDKQGKSGLLIGNPRARYWDAYENMMKEYAKAPDDRFRQLFGDAFGRAYEEQLARLGSARSKPRHGQK